MAESKTKKKVVSPKAGKEGYVKVEFTKDSKSGFKKGELKVFNERQAAKIVEKGFGKIVK